MRCLKPLELPDKLHDSFVRVACGKCTPCLIRRRNYWVGRMLLERFDSPPQAGRFLTLTYADEHNPEVLRYDHFRDWAKRYRKSRGDFRYFAVGEIGPKTHRPHWHVIDFSNPRELPLPGFVRSPVRASWPYGWVYEGTVTTASARYCAAYMFKANNTWTPELGNGGPFMSRNPGIGLDRARSMGRIAAARFQEVECKAWPGSYSLILPGKKKSWFPMFGRLLEAFQEGFFEAGGLPPVEQSPDDRIMFDPDETLGDLLRSERLAKSDYFQRTLGHWYAKANGKTF